MAKYSVGINTIIPTYNRPDSLQRTLNSLAVAYRNGPLDDIDVIVVDNLGQESTKQIVLGIDYPFRIDYEICEKRGKNNALNYGLKKTRREWVLFLDDDVEVVEDYLCVIVSALKSWKNAAAFGGRVIPEWPLEYENELHPTVAEEFRSLAFCAFEPHKSSGVHNPGHAVMEANMVVGRKYLDMAGRFDTQCGPNGNRYRMGSHGSLFLKLKEWEKDVIYLSDAIVYHQIRPEQFTYRWLTKRAFSYGRSLCYLKYGARGFSGEDCVGDLLFLFFNRLIRQVFFIVKGKEVPRRVAQLEKVILKGILYEKLFAANSESGSELDGK